MKTETNNKVINKPEKTVLFFSVLEVKGVCLFFKSLNFNQFVLKDIKILQSASDQCYGTLLDSSYECALENVKNI